ncbi:MAG: hypothetical protein ACI9M3_000834 [Bacteroidia bacterium]|jgi:hypothetical protein
MENNELKHLLIAYKSTVIGLQTTHDEILSLFSVVGQSEQLTFNCDYCQDEGVMITGMNCDCKAAPKKS